MTLVATGDLAPARRILVRASRRLAAGQEGSASLDLRTARAVHGARLSELDLELAVPRGSASVLEALERWRSATDRLPSLGRPDDEQLAQLTEQLRAVRGHLRGEGDPAQARELHDHASRLERQIRDRDWALSRSGGASRAVPVRVREAREHLGRVDRDLVWFFRHRGRIGAVGSRRRTRDDARPHAGRPGRGARPAHPRRPAGRGDPPPRPARRRRLVLAASQRDRARRRAAAAVAHGAGASSS